MDTQQEKIFYKDPNVTVTQAKFIAGSETYAIKDISSVSNFEIIKSKRGPIIIMAFGVILLIPSGLRILGGILIILGFTWLFSVKNEYAVRISTNAGVVDSIVSQNRDYIQKIVNTLNEALFSGEHSL